ncbi:MAG: DUF58 domain-containing protein [Planctomycetes bacterium]|nr:DUF58 domain-containing protein [Planctomycetota bacterium]
MMFRRQTTVCREGWYYLVIVALVLGGAMLKEVNLLLILAGMLLGPVLLNWRAVGLALRGLKIERRLPLRVGAGDPLAVGLNLTNTRRRLGSWAIVAEEQIQREADTRRGRRPTTLRPSVLFPYVRAGQWRKGGYRGRLERRGRYRFGPIRLSTRFPFGLFSKTITVGRPETLIVLPRLGRLTEGWTARRMEAFAGADRRRNRPGLEGDFYGVRQWRAGDGKRLIHWRSSARTGELTVRQFERPRSRDVAVVLDLWQPDPPAAEHLETVELAVGFAATVLTDLCRKGGSNVYLTLADDEPDCIGGPASPATLQNLTERLALIEARAEDALPELLAHALRRTASDTEVVLVGTRPVDLADASRLALLWSDPVLRERTQRIRCIDASSKRLAEFFQAE